MSELKTKKNNASVAAFLDGIENEKRRDDCRAVVKLMADVTGERPKMWGGSIIGFGSYHYTYASGREGDWMATGVSPRKQSLTLYIMTGFPPVRCADEGARYVHDREVVPLHQEARGRRHERSEEARSRVVQETLEGNVRRVMTAR